MMWLQQQHQPNTGLLVRLRSSTFGRRVSFLAEGVKRDSEGSHLLKMVASGGPWHSEEQGEEALVTRLLPWAKMPPARLSDLDFELLM